MPIPSRFLSASLAVLLALSAFLPCYTLAYADEGAEVIADDQLSADNRFGERTSEVGGGQEFEGVLPNWGSEALPLSEESGCFSDFASADSAPAPVSGLDSVEGQYSYSLADSLTLGGLDDVQAQANSYSFDGAGTSATNDRGQFSDDATDEGAAGRGIENYREGFGEAEASSQADGRSNLGFFEPGVSPYATSFSVIDTLVASSWSGEGTQFVIGSNKLSVKNGTILWAVVAAADQLESILSTLQSYKTSSLNYQQAIDTAAKGIRSMLGMQWGTTYGSTAVFTTNSPAGWLKRLYEYNYQQWGYDYDIVDGGAIYNGSPAYFLKWLYNSQWTAWGGNYQTGSPSLIGNSPAGWLRSLYNYSYQQWGYDYGKGSAGWYDNSPAGWLNSLYKNNYSQWGWDYGLSSEGWRPDSPAAWLNKMYRYTYEQWGYDYSLGSGGAYYPDSPAAWLRSVKIETDGLSSTLSALYGRVASDSSLLSVLSRLNDIWLSLESDTGISRLLAAWASRWDVQDRVMMEWASRWDVLYRVLVEWGKSWESFRDGVLSSLDGGLSADMSGVESRLDDIKNLLLLAGVKDIVDTIVGDLDFAKLGVLSGEVQGAVSNAFPFCVPAVLKQVLGLVRYEGAAPVWDFDIGGESMHVDLSTMQPLADVSGWVCRIAFTVLLLASSRRFVFVGGGVQ